VSCVFRERERERERGNGVDIGVYPGFYSGEVSQGRIENNLKRVEPGDLGDFVPQKLKQKCEINLRFLRLLYKI